MSSSSRLVADPEQDDAIRSAERATAVLAGPGSGKTLVVSRRAEFLLSPNRDSRALLLTFTNKAAAEMKARVLKETDLGSDRITASTFHTFGMRLLRAHGNLIGISSDFGLLDDEQGEAFRSEMEGRVSIGDQSGRLSFLRLRRQDPPERLVQEYGEAYSSAKAAANLLDFDDLVVLAADLLERHPEVAEAYQARYPHLLVDEFQDTNAAQFAIVRALVGPSGTVSVFADDDQAIYQFAGAEAENVRRFVAELHARTYPLTFNYRCRSEIVTVANRLIAADPRASGRQMRAYHDGGEVIVRAFSSTVDEATGVATEIAALVNQGQVRPSDVAVLGRAGRRLEAVLGALQAGGVPTSSWLTGHGNRERHLLRTCLSVIRGQLSDIQARDLLAFLGIDDSGERSAVAILESNRESAAVVALLEVRRLAWSGASVTEGVKAAAAAVAASDDGLDQQLDDVIEGVAAFEALDPDFSLEHLDAELALRSTGAPTASGGVKIASLHRTKGLQWPHVYVLGLEQGQT
jgi:superfamily I DNA/RNA helicase